MRWRFLVVSLLALIASAAPGWADQVLLKNRAVTCVATTPNIVRMWIEGVGFVLAPEHSSAHALIHLQLRDNSQLAYSVNGQADRIDKDLQPNRNARSIAYAGIACTVFHRNITSVHDCRGTAGSRTCEVGLDFSGERHAYLVSLSIKPVR
jgi:hypothetical protein